MIRDNNEKLSNRTIIDDKRQLLCIRPDHRLTDLGSTSSFLYPSQLSSPKEYRSSSLKRQMMNQIPLQGEHIMQRMRGQSLNPVLPLLQQQQIYNTSLNSNLIQNYHPSPKRQIQSKQYLFGQEREVSPIKNISFENSTTTFSEESTQFRNFIEREALLSNLSITEPIVSVRKTFILPEEDELESRQQLVGQHKYPKLKDKRPILLYDPCNDPDNYLTKLQDTNSIDQAQQIKNEQVTTNDSIKQQIAIKSPSVQQKASKAQSQTTEPQTKIITKKLPTNELVFNVSDTKYPVIKFVGKNIMKWKLDYESETMVWDVLWTDNSVQADFLMKMQPYQKINHFPGMFNLARKNYLARNLGKLQRMFPQQYNFYPETWLLPAQYNEFKIVMEHSKQNNRQSTFIAKPEAGCQGRGIFLTKTIDDFNPADHYVVQRYVNNPYLIDGLKFDFRLYVLVAGCDPLRIYLFYEGLARLATEKYKEPAQDNLENLCMHLTNYAINKGNPNFQFNTDSEYMDIGHKRSLSSVLDLLACEGHDVNRLWKEIKRVIIKTIICAQPVLSHQYKSSQPDNYANNMCFELLGFDIMIDEKLRPWLIEVNHTPSFTTDTPLDSFIKKNAIRDCLRLIGVNRKERIEIINHRKEVMQQRVLTGKKIKLTLEEKQEQIFLAQRKRDIQEDSQLGGFEKIFPVSDDEKDTFSEYIEQAQRNFEESTGAHIRRNGKRIIEDQTTINFQKMMPNKFIIEKVLQKIYTSQNQQSTLTKKQFQNPGIEKSLQKERTISEENFSTIPSRSKEPQLSPYQKSSQHQKGKKLKKRNKHGQFINESLEQCTSDSYNVQITQHQEDSTQEDIIQQQLVYNQTNNILKRPISISSVKQSLNSSMTNSQKKMKVSSQNSQIIEVVSTNEVQNRGLPRNQSKITAQYSQKKEKTNFQNFNSHLYENGYSGEETKQLRDQYISEANKPQNNHESNPNQSYSYNVQSSEDQMDSEFQEQITHPENFNQLTKEQANHQVRQGRQDKSKQEFRNKIKQSDSRQQLETNPNVSRSRTSSYFEQSQERIRHLQSERTQKLRRNRIEPPLFI